MSKTVDHRSAHQQDRYRIVRVNFRRSHPAWWDDPTIIAVLLMITVLLAGVLVLLPPRLLHGG